MRNILSEEARPVLERVARDRILLAFDFDGTLAPIVDDPGAAQMRHSTRALLRLVTLLYPCAIVSGRRREEIVQRTEGIPLVALVGNHGAEPGQGPVDGGVRCRVVSWHAQLRSSLDHLQGVEMEDKGLSLAIHYRRAPSQSQAKEAVTAAAEALEGARLSAGHAVLNVVPADLPDKGIAVAQLVWRFRREGAFYVGDDETDEDAFRNGVVRVAVRVGPSSSSAARYLLPAQSDIDDLLRALIRIRRQLDGLDDRIEGLEQMFTW